MRTVVIVGTGLLGSSFGLAVKHGKIFRRVIGVSSPAVVEKALAVGAIDEAMPIEKALPLADLVLLAQPVRRILKLIETLDPMLKPGAVVTDVGSTKVEICAAATQYITRARFVGGHPMAGREVRGPEGASADLFVGRPWVLTADDPDLVRLIQTFGALPVLLSAEEHDRMVAYSSHLPQLLSTGLAGFVASRDLKRVAGPGLIDMTRLALSSYELWDDILATNAANIDTALEGLIGELEHLRAALREGRGAEAFRQGNSFASYLRG